jgi:cytochrome P450
MSSAYDLFGAEFKRDPFPTFARMRQDDPVYAHVSPGGVTTWYITRYEDVIAILRDNEHFVKDVRQTRHPKPVSRDPVTEYGIRNTGSKQPTLHQLINQNMLFSDPPDHTRLRALVNQAFTPRRVEQMHGRIQQIAHELLDNVQTSDFSEKSDVSHSSKIELLADYALPLSVVVISEMLGIPTADQASVADYSQAIIAPGGKGLGGRARKQKMRALVDYLQQMFAHRRQYPQDDLVTALVQAKTADDRLSEAELSSMVALLLVTGHETTVNLIGNGVLALLQHPEQLRLVMEDEGVWGTAVEELLRYDGPVETSTTRWVRDDYTFKGHQMRRGEVVRVSLASANRDEAYFACPDVLDVTRTENKHLAFGHGIHYCLGAPLARLEGRIAIGTLFRRFPDLRLGVTADQLQWRPGVLFRGLVSLPVVW